MSGASQPPERIPSLDFYTVAHGELPLDAAEHHMVMFPGPIPPEVLSKARKAAQLGPNVVTEHYSDPVYGDRVDIRPGISGSTGLRFREAMARGLGASIVRSVSMTELDPNKRELPFPRQTTTADMRHALLGLIRLVTSRQSLRG